MSRRRRSRRGGKKGEVKTEPKLAVKVPAKTEIKHPDGARDAVHHPAKGGKKHAVAAVEVPTVSASGENHRKRTHRGGRRHRGNKPKTTEG